MCSEVEETCSEFLRELEEYQLFMKDSVSEFLGNVDLNVLFIQAVDTTAVTVLLAQSLDKLCKTNSPLSKKSDRTFIEWSRLVELVERKGELPKLTDLVVCEIRQFKNVSREMETLKKLTEWSEDAVSKKLVFIGSMNTTLNEYMRKLTRIGQVLKISEVWSRPKEQKQKNMCQKEALLQAAFEGRANDVRRIIEGGVGVNETSGTDRKTAIHSASEGGQKNVFLLLWGLGAKLEMLDSNRDTPLHLAAKNGHQDVVLAILDKNIDINIKGNQGRTALHIAAENGDRNLLLSLLRRKADKNATDDNNRTPLHLAAAKGLKETVRVLAVNDANVNIKDNMKKNALELAEENGHNDVVEILLKYSRDLDKHKVLLRSAKGGDILTVQSVLDGKTDVNIKDLSGMTPLHWAAFNGHNDVVEVLLRHRSAIDVQNSSKMTALHLACEKGHATVVQTLVHRKANVNTTDRDRMTPLHLAVIKNHCEIVRILVENGAKVNEKDNRGYTPLRLAYTIAVVNLLKSKGAIL